MSSLSVVLPVYNERQNLEILIPELERILSNTKGIDDFKIIVCDDYSPDGTEGLCYRFMVEYGNIIYSGNDRQSFTKAVIRGLKIARELDSDYVIQMDGDLSHNPYYIPEFLLFTKEKGYDLVIGSRSRKFQVEWSFIRKVRSSFSSWLARQILGLNTKDPTSGYHCFSKKCLEILKSQNWISKGFEVEVEIATLAERNGLKICEFPITFDKRYHGKSKISWKEIFRFLWLIWNLRPQTKVSKS